MSYKKPNAITYSALHNLALVLSRSVFKNEKLRNELKNEKGPCVVIANHESAMDPVNMLAACRRPATFVLSNAYANTMPEIIQPTLRRMNPIVKQQFQTSIKDVKRMLDVVKSGGVLVIYPAGMMTEDGASTPIPEATYKLVRKLGVNTYVARSSGMYFVHPKWTSGIRKGRTTLDIYKLFDAEELKTLGDDKIKEAIAEALLFDSYKDQESALVKYDSANNIEGLEKVLYQCPECGEEFTINAVCAEGSEVKNTLRCACCGYEQTADDYGIFHNRKGLGREIKFPSEWSRKILDKLKADIEEKEFSISCNVRIKKLDYNSHSFKEIGAGRLSLSRENLELVSEEGGISISQKPHKFPILPFVPGKQIDIQDGEDVYRCFPENPEIVMKIINSIKAIHTLAAEKK